MYEARYPAADDLVVVQVKNVAEMGAYVSLLEYDNIEGMILLSELSRRRIRSINKLIRVGRTEIVVVLRVDKEKGYIDLSKRRVSPEDILKAEEKFNKSKAVHSIMRHVSETCHVRLEDIYNQFGWDLYKRFGHAYDAFKLMVTCVHHTHTELLAAHNPLQRSPADSAVAALCVHCALCRPPVRVRRCLSRTTWLPTCRMLC